MRWILLVMLSLLPLLGCGQGEGNGGDGSISVEHLVEGTGIQPTPRDTVEVHYHGTLDDGTVFDSSVDRGQTAKFPLTRVIRCWTEAIPQMKVGGKAIITCPADSAYGAQQKGVIPPHSRLTFEVELFSVR